MKLVTRIFCAALVVALPLSAQTVNKKKDPYAQYKRVHQNVLHALQGGDADDALRQLFEYRERDSDDPDNWFMLGIVYAHRGEDDKALESIDTALKLGLPPGRIHAEQNNLLIPLMENPTFRSQIENRGAQVIHGPMIGRLGPESASFWVRLALEGDVTAELTSNDDPETVIKSSSARATQDTDFTAVMTVDGLQADTEYVYSVRLSATVNAGPYRFRTAPRRGKPAAFSIGFGGGAGYVPKHERMWHQLRAQGPLAFFFLGDNIYPDAPESNEVQRYSYYRRQSRPEYREFLESTAIFAVWDDHDFGTNDCSGGADVADPAWKPTVWNIFRQNWVNPAYGGGEGVYGCWFKTAIGDVDFFMLDSRYYRTDPRQTRPEQRSMLGPVQKQWLLDGLAASTATFKIICTPVPMSSDTKPGSLDTWDGFAQERAEIFAHLDAHAIEGVFILSADRHRSDAWKIERDKSYPLYEFESSRMTNQHQHKELPSALFSYNDTQSFGMLDINTKIDDPSVTYRIINIEGDEVHRMAVRLSEMRMP
jgi:alkaline phosphatase D